MCAQLRKPALRLDVDLLDLTDLSVPNERIDLLHLLGVFLLMADDRLDMVVSAKLGDMVRLAKVHRHGLFKGEHLYPIAHGKLDHLRADVRVRYENEHLGARLAQHGFGIRERRNV